MNSRLFEILAFGGVPPLSLCPSCLSEAARDAFDASECCVVGLLIRAAAAMLISTRARARAVGLLRLDSF